mmetsp:Transcript_3137/g.9813  ORF Transcript_3137/g.9813 Transcript_3137/m.9813 type:complete len:278 (-) Transcript_3137:244-1077(-)
MPLRVWLAFGDGEGYSAASAAVRPRVGWSRAVVPVSAAVLEELVVEPELLDRLLGARCEEEEVEVEENEEALLVACAAAPLSARRLPFAMRRPPPVELLVLAVPLLLEASLRCCREWSRWRLMPSRTVSPREVARLAIASRTRCCCASKLSRSGKSFSTSRSIVWSGRRLRPELHFMRQKGHSFLPQRRAVVTQSLQKRCKQLVVVTGSVVKSKHTGHLSRSFRRLTSTLTMVSSVFNALGGFPCTRKDHSSCLIFNCRACSSLDVLKSIEGSGALP